MKRPSNLIIAFILAILITFGAYAFSRIIFRILEAPVVEVEE